MRNFFNNLVNVSTVGFVDTCFLVSSSFTDYFYPKLDKFNRGNPEKELMLNILPSCFLELQNLALNGKKSRAERARRVLAIIKKDMNENHNFKLYKEGLCMQFADVALLYAVVMTKLSSPVYVFTQDNKLIHDLYDCNNLQSCQGYGVKVSSFDEKNGRLITPGAANNVRKTGKKKSVMSMQISTKM